MGNDEIAHFKESLPAELNDYIEDSETDVADPKISAILDKRVVRNRSGSKQAYYLLEWDDKDIQPLFEMLRNIPSGNVSKQFEDSLLKEIIIK